jgi:hypothetical protein
MLPSYQAGRKSLQGWRPRRHNAGAVSFGAIATHRDCRTITDSSPEQEAIIKGEAGPIAQTDAPCFKWALVRCSGARHLCLLATPAGLGAPAWVDGRMIERRRRWFAALEAGQQSS